MSDTSCGDFIVASALRDGYIQKLKGPPSCVNTITKPSSKTGGLDSGLGPWAQPARLVL